tara:strand:+ start:576 stop:863 length:288 start_codon:yes stop_codon:yes gene_type:complete
MAIEKKNKPNLANAIRKISNDAMFVITEEQVYENIEWLDGTTPIPKKQLEDKLAEMQIDWDNEIKAEQDLKTSAKSKLMNGEKLTEDEANIMVGL